MNVEQKQRALQMLRRFEQADPMTRQVDNTAVDMAALLHELIDATEPEPHYSVQITPSKDQLTQIINGLDHCFSDESRRKFLSAWICDWTAHKLSVRPTPSVPVAYMTRDGIVASRRQVETNTASTIASGFTIPLYTAPPAPSVPDMPLQIFDNGPWIWKETGESFTGTDLDAAAFAKYRDLLAATAPPSSANYTMSLSEERERM